LQKRGEDIVASVEATDVSEARIDLHAPDTRVISQPSHDVIGLGTFKRKLVWTVVRKGATAIVEITVSDGSLTQAGLCRVSQ